MRKLIITTIFFTLILTSCSPADVQYQNKTSDTVSVSQPQAETPSTNNNSTTSGCSDINKKVFNVKLFMTYEKVVQILEKEGDVVNRDPTYGNCPSVDLCPSIAYIWKFSGVCSCEFNARFTNGALNSIGTNCVD